MGLRVNANLPAMNAARQSRRNVNALGVQLNRLASGLRINRAADNAAGLAIAEHFAAQVRQYTQEANNLQTGVNALQTAEGGLAVQQEAVGRIRELAVQAANGTMTDENRQALNQEAQQLIEQIGNVAERTEFNETQLLTGEIENLPLGTEAGNEININESTPEYLGIEDLDISTVEGANAAIEALDTANQRVSRNRVGIGAQENRLERAIEQRAIGVEESAASESAIRDADLARVTMEQTRSQILLQGDLSAMVQSNIVPQTALRLLGG